MIQTTLVQLDNYGPWTVTPDPRPEMQLQALQSRLYADVAERFGASDGYAFYARGDNLIAVTNAIDRAEHESVQGRLADRYPVTASMAIGTGATPASALDEATARLQDAGSAQSSTRRAVLTGEPLAAGDDEEVHIAHFDVADVTGDYTDRRSAFETYHVVEQGYDALRDYLYRTHDALSFFVGGDNVISICPALSDDAYRDAVAHVRETTGLDLRVGVGDGTTAKAAGMAAKHALEIARERDQRVNGATVG